MVREFKYRRGKEIGFDHLTSAYLCGCAPYRYHSSEREMAKDVSLGCKYTVQLYLRIESYSHDLSLVYSLTRIRKRVPKSEVVVGSLGHKKEWVELAMEVYVRHYGEVVE